MNRTLSYEQAQKIIDAGDPDIKETLINYWAKPIVYRNPIFVTEDFYNKIKYQCNNIQLNMFNEYLGIDAGNEKFLDKIVTRTEGGKLFISKFTKNNLDGTVMEERLYSIYHLLVNCETSIRTFLYHNINDFKKFQLNEANDKEIMQFRLNYMINEICFRGNRVVKIKDVIVENSFNYVKLTTDELVIAGYLSKITNLAEVLKNFK